MELALTNGIVSNTQWKCTNQTEENWNTIDFDDSHWLPPMQVGHDVPIIGCNAMNIWSQNCTTEEYFYCRFTVRK